MINETFKQILTFIGLVLLQVLILNNICFLGYINPYFYIYFILVAPSSINKDLLLLLGFVLGLCVDVFCGTLGCHAFATTLIAYLKPYFHKLFGPRETYEESEPSMKGFGVGAFMKYVSLLVLVHHLAFFYVETMSLAHFFRTFIVAVGCSAFTTLLIYLVQRLKRV